jgi:superfamily I DNA/RNA helicase
VAGDTASQEQVRESEDAAKRLLYVALSRACQRLVMVTDSEDPSRFEAGLDPEQWDHAL